MVKASWMHIADVEDYQVALAHLPRRLPKRWPGTPITLRQGARVIEDSRRLRSTARAVTTKMLISLGRPSAICSSVRRPCA